jgi:hypothetical protein
MLSDQEKRLRDWLLEHPGGSEMWLIVKGGFRKSYDLGLADAPRVSPSVNRECLCVAEHRPTPLAYESHHIWPLGMGGPDTPANRVWLCPTAHTNAHEILRELMRRGPLSWRDVLDLFPVQVSRYAYRVALAGHRAWLNNSAHTL